MSIIKLTSTSDMFHLERPDQQFVVDSQNNVYAVAIDPSRSTLYRQYYCSKHINASTMFLLKKDVRSIDCTRITPDMIDMSINRIGTGMPFYQQVLVRYPVDFTPEHYIDRIWINGQPLYVHYIMPESRHNIFESHGEVLLAYDPYHMLVPGYSSTYFFGIDREVMDDIRKVFINLSRSDFIVPWFEEYGDINIMFSNGKPIIIRRRCFGCVIFF